MCACVVYLYILLYYYLLCMCVVEARRGHLLYYSFPYCFETVFFIESELRLAISNPQRLFCLYYPPVGTGVKSTHAHAQHFMWVLGFWTQMLKLAQQALLPNPESFPWSHPLLKIDFHISAGWAWTLYMAKGGGGCSWTPDLPALPHECWGYNCVPSHLGYVLLGIVPRSLWMLGKHCTKWTISQPQVWALLRVTRYPSSGCLLSNLSWPSAYGLHHNG